MRYFSPARDAPEVVTGGPCFLDEEEYAVVTESQNRMTEGPIGKKIIRFALPLFLGNLFQQLYNIADTLIVGNLLGNNALAAVSSTGSLVFLLVSLFNGVSMGSGVVVSRFFGAKDMERMQKAIHTALAFSLSAGVAVSVFGALVSPQLLVWMDTPPEVPVSYTHLTLPTIYSV